MKPIISRLSEHSPLFFFPLLLLFRSGWRKYILFLFGVIILAGCYNKFYKTGTAQKVDATTIERLKSAQKYFIIHFRDEALSLTDVTMNEQFLSGKTGPLPAVHSKGLHPDQNGSGTFKEPYRYPLLSEVHLYVNKNKAEVAGFPDIQVAASDLYRMDIYEFDEKRTKSASTMSTVGIVVGAAAVIAGIAIIAGSSEPAPAPSDGQSCGCPQVYVEKLGDFQFQNGLFSGAVFNNLERTDYLPLGQLQTDHSTIRLRIAGHQDEVQYLNTAKLVAISHQPGSKVLADRNGKFYAINNPELPVLAVGPDQEDLKSLISKVDNTSFAFSGTDLDENYSTAVLTFRRPAENGKAKLVIRAKNSNWSAQINQEYTLLLGNEYSRYRNYMEKKSERAMESVVLKQGLPIKVYVGNGENWDYAGYYPLTGTEGFREMVMEISLPESKEQDLRVKLETVYRFWDLDYAAIDFSTDASLQTTSYDPATAQHNLKMDQKKQVAAKDQAYTELQKDESIDLSFDVLEGKGNTTVSYFLESSGYYHIQGTYPINANMSRLKAFRNEGEFNRFSKEKFRELEEWQSRVNWLNHGSE